MKQDTGELSGVSVQTLDRRTELKEMSEGAMPSPGEEPFRQNRTVSVKFLRLKHSW